jgi:hypothetical protein
MFVAVPNVLMLPNVVIYRSIYLHRYTLNAA